MHYGTQDCLGQSKILSIVTLEIIFFHINVSILSENYDYSLTQEISGEEIAFTYTVYELDGS